MSHSIEPSFIENNTWLIALVCLLVGGALLGISTNLAKYAGEIGLGPLAFLFWSLLGAAIVLVIVAFMRGELLAPSRRSFEYYIVAALVSVAGSNLIFFSAIPHVGASFVALIISLPPLLTYLGALMLNIERFSVMRALGVAAALAGVGVLAARKFATPDTSMFWILLALCGPVLLAIGNIYRTLRWPDNASPIALAPGMLIAAVILLGLVGTLPDFSLMVSLENSNSALLILVQAIIFAVQFVLLFVLQKTGGPVLLSLLGAVGAIVGVPVAVILQGEALPEGLVVGGSLIALGVILVTWGGMKMATLPQSKLKE
ncbi:DMT family transporter [Psychrobacter sp. DM4]|uniref:DMT family transporter n=1 Tax=Psychrobacter sp. DM4 TaxID=3440637 RepID=UPI003F50D0B7